MRNGIKSEHWNDANGNPAGGVTQGTGFTISWQNGPLGACTCPADNPEIATASRNGLHLRGICQRKAPNGAFVEDVIGAAQDRLVHYQGSKFADEYNERALKCLAEALGHLQARTATRELLGVEGTHEVTPAA